VLFRVLVLQHAVILHAVNGGRPQSFVQDLGSSSGTFLDGKQIASHKPEPLTDGAAISFGESKATYKFRVGAPRGAAGGAPPRKKQR